MTIGGQYGEDGIVLEFFKEKRHQTVMDIGAADGITNSNSYCLLQSPLWSGILVEPEPSQYKALAERYAGVDRVKTFNCACGPRACTGAFYCGGQVSTLDLDWRDRCVEIHNIDYQEIEVDVRTPNDILEGIEGIDRIDFLTIDAEGYDMVILKSFDVHRYRPSLICLEGHGIPDFLMDAGYHVHLSTHGNIFLAKEWR